jgi:hypothetical protein
MLVHDRSWRYLARELLLGSADASLSQFQTAFELSRAEASNRRLMLGWIV